MVLYGKSTPQPGETPAWQIPNDPSPEAASLRPVYLWAHKSVDGAGAGADHFSLLCQETMLCLLLEYMITLTWGHVSVLGMPGHSALRSCQFMLNLNIYIYMFTHSTMPLLATLALTGHAHF